MIADARLTAARTARIAWLESQGELDPTCPGCTAAYTFYREQWEPGRPSWFGPPHKASPHCESGRYAHCSCDTCF